MKSIQQVCAAGLNIFLATILVGSSALAQQVTQTTPANSSSPATVVAAATAGIAIAAVIQVLFVAVLVFGLLAGGDAGPEHGNALQKGK